MHLGILLRYTVIMCVHFFIIPALVNMQCVFLMNPQCFPMSQCATKQTQRRHEFIQHCVCICASLLASHACLPDSYSTMKQLQRETFSWPHLLTALKKKLLWPHDMVKSGFLFPHRSLRNTCTEANTQYLIRHRIV